MDIRKFSCENLPPFDWALSAEAAVLAFITVLSQNASDISINSLSLVLQTPPNLPRKDVMSHSIFYAMTGTGEKRISQVPSLFVDSSFLYISCHRLYVVSVYYIV